MSGLQTAVVDMLTAEILIFKQQTAQNIIEIGKRLIEVKETLGHGEWENWLKEKIDFSNVTAWRFMKAAQSFGNLSTLKDLSQSKIFALLDLPADQREEFIQQNPVNEMTTRELQQAIKAQKEAERRAEDAEQEAERLRNVTSEFYAENDSALEEAIKLKKDNEFLASSLERQTKSLEQQRTKIATVTDLEEENELLRQENKKLYDRPATTVIPADYEHLKIANQILENKLKTAADPIIVETPVQVFPPDYERVKRENAELKARQQNISLQQLAQVDENCRQYAKTVADEEKSAKIIRKVLDVLIELPNGAEVDELTRCYLKYSPADTQDEITVTCMELEHGIDRLKKLHTSMKNSTKLKVVR